MVLDVGDVAAAVRTAAQRRLRLLVDLIRYRARRRFVSRSTAGLLARALLAASASCERRRLSLRPALRRTELPLQLLDPLELLRDLPRLLRKLTPQPLVLRAELGVVLVLGRRRALGNDANRSRASRSRQRHRSHDHPCYRRYPCTISINDTPLHHLETVYRRLIERITTAADGSGAFQPIVDGWLYEIGEQVTRLSGIEEDDPAFVAAVQTKLEEKLATISRENSAFASVLRAYHRASEEGEHHTASRLLAWLGGEPDVPRSLLTQAGVKGTVDGTAALTFLRGLLTLLRQSDHAGLVVVLDEVETIQLMPSQTRDKSLNALRQLVDMLANGELPGLYLVVTGTPEFFEGYKGLRGAQALHQRVAIRFDASAEHDNLRAPQVRLQPFSGERLVEVGMKIRRMFPARNPERVLATVDEDFVHALVAKVVEGFGGKVAVTPRYFLRELVDIMDRVDLHATFDPRSTYQLRVDEDALTPEELAARRGTPPASEIELAQHKPAPHPAPSDEPVPKKRLDG